MNLKETIAKDLLSIRAVFFACPHGTPIRL